MLSVWREFLSYFSQGRCPRLILVNTLPKSGSVFIKDALLKTLSRYRFSYISQSSFADDYINTDYLRQITGDRIVSQEHINASPNNVEILKRYLPKFVLHLRDPRQVVLLWCFHVDQVDPSITGIWSSDIRPSQNYANFCFSEKIDWQIEHFLPVCVKWIEDWCRIIDSGELNILVTRYEDLLLDTDEFLRKLLAFYDLYPKQLRYEDFSAKNSYLHHRRGRADEWRWTMTGNQIRRVYDLVPLPLLRRFEWE